ncbi:30S ribosomal protein S9 [Candidatus Cerribacteria bacterium 'Amazon FNV 2010 28 9']|uniref:30S ribosomal protein S9 n=1 Tax=Candidatus Cerribacteria bacterium 'Amazon FNV 2010 28 9' TaxID=2081795 RepID=A0A317JQ80_9BACT|nr:MAG: 30S ribosomal protein S9 [Candidatus Cerribacteria bacterium 'Amazon FNV 2010 28 9']
MPLKKKTQVIQKVVKKAPAAAPAKGKRGDYIATVGRRKTSVARVRLYRGSGENTVNDKSFQEFFGDWICRSQVLEPLFATEMDKSVSFSVKVSGGGKKSQAQAVAHGISRGLIKLNEELKATLRKKGLLTRDPRMKETRKIGTGGKARRAKQSPKR